MKYIKGSHRNPTEIPTEMYSALKEQHIIEDTYIFDRKIIVFPESRQ